MKTVYEIVQHPRSGDRYVVESIAGIIRRATGPLHHSESPDPSEMRAYLDNQPDTDTLNDGYWLAIEIAKAR